jgi:hypothetical protein
MDTAGFESAVWIIFCVVPTFRKFGLIEGDFPLQSLTEGDHYPLEPSSVTHPD